MMGIEEMRKMVESLSLGQRLDIRGGDFAVFKNPDAWLVVDIIWGSESVDSKEFSTPGGAANYATFLSNREATTTQTGESQQCRTWK